MFTNKEEILEKAKSVIGKKFSDIDIHSRISNGKTKGIYGHIIEESLFNYQINSSKAPDFAHLGIELKVTPLKRIKSGEYRAKERLVLNIIDYMSEYKYDFYASSFWKKNQILLLIFYLYQDDIEFSELVIKDVLLYEYPEIDLIIIMNDWKIIIDKIKNGKAHQLSGTDTLYLEASTKGANSKTLRKQPFSNVKAKQRAYALKASYMNAMINKNLKLNDTQDKIIKDKTALKDNTFEDYMIAVINRYRGLSIDSLKEKFKITSKAKNINSLIIAKLFDVRNLTKTEEFTKANIKVKTIHQNENGTIKQSMSFPTFKYTEIVKETWETSSLRTMFLETRWFFIIFKDNDTSIKLEKALFWSMPKDDLENHMRELWEDTQKKVMSGKIFKEYDKKGNKRTHFLGLKDSKVGHVRPHGINKNDTFELPVPDQKLGVNEYTKSCFWLNSKYIKQIVESHT